MKDNLLYNKKIKLHLNNSTNYSHIASDITDCNC